jgi:hypothetical protein
MFSFGGFSSILPYIVYLSVMWVCILIGASGQMNKLLGIIAAPNHSIESTVREKRNVSNTVFYKKIVKNNSLKSKEAFAAFLFLPVQTVVPDKIIYLDKDKKLSPEHNTVFNGLRAPPCLI